MSDRKATILIVEDEPKLAALLRDYLTSGGFETRTIANGAEVIPAVREAEPDLILLDLMLPGKDGMDVCRELRGFSQVPVIMVTARVEEVDRLIGLELGADDYVCKPFHPREVVARVKSQLRRVQWLRNPNSSVSGLALDVAKYEARLHGQTLPLTPVEFRLLNTLFKQPGRVFSRDQLIKRVYVDHRVVTDRTVDTHIKNLRKKVQALLPDRELIRSVYGVGYKLELAEE